MKCKRCNVEMVVSKALRCVAVGLPDFEGDTGREPGCTIAEIGPPYLDDCLKCPLCDYSVSLRE